jgi:hypothetical protein
LHLGGSVLGALLRDRMFPRFVLDKPVSHSAQNDAEDQSVEKTSHNVPFFDVCGMRSRLIDKWSVGETPTRAAKTVALPGTQKMSVNWMGMVCGLDVISEKWGCWG